MNDTRTLVPAARRAAWRATPVGLADVSRRHLATLRSMIASVGERMRFRWELKQKLKDNPHLIDDIGLTRRQAEAEIAKPFWQA